MSWEKEEHRSRHVDFANVSTCQSHRSVNSDETVNLPHNLNAVDEIELVEQRDQEIWEGEKVRGNLRGIIERNCGETRGELKIASVGKPAGNCREKKRGKPGGNYIAVTQLYNELLMHE